MAALTCFVTKCGAQIKCLRVVRQTYCAYRNELNNQKLSQQRRLCSLNNAAVAHYSSETTSSVKKPSLTEEFSILKDRVDSTNEGDQKKKEGSSSGGDGSEKKKFEWTLTKKLIAGSAVAWTVMMGGGVLMMFGTPQKDPEGNDIVDEFTGRWFEYLLRCRKEVFQQIKITKEPSRAKLLPDPLQYPYIQPKYTLVLEMNDILVHPDWTYSTGWRFKKRPGIEQFLRAVGPPLFEVVIYTSDVGFTADPILTKIDPENYIMYRLYKDATRYYNSHHVKDLSCLNRDLSRVIMVDWNPKSYQLNPENGFNIRRWQGEDSDVALHDLALFLRALASSNVEDVRPVLRYYSQFDDPLEQFRENQRKLKEQQEEQARQLKDQEKTMLPKSYSRFGFRK